jgi:DNA-directed RNA polymerase subunit F
MRVKESQSKFLAAKIFENWNEVGSEGNVWRRSFLAGWVAMISLVLIVGIATPSLAQGRRDRRAQKQQAARRPGHHAGEWLRQYKDLPRDQQQQALDNDPQFRNLPPERQQKLKEQLQRFSSLPQDRQQRILDRMETWEHLTPDQKQQAKQLFSQIKDLPPERRQMVQRAIDNLRNMPPDQRQQVISSDRFKNQFSEQERGLLSGISQLPLAPAESGQNDQGSEE